jgi:hypothetical protein
MGLFGESAQSNFRRAQKLIEDVLTSMGLNADKSRLDTKDGSTAWGLMRGSAEVLVFLNAARKEGDDNFLRIVSPIVRLPTENLLPLYRRLLELNARDLPGIAFGVVDQDIVLVAQRGTRDLDRSEVDEMLRNLGAAADHYDDKLAQEFGGRKISDLPREERST